MTGDSETAVTETSAIEDVATDISETQAAPTAETIETTSAETNSTGDAPKAANMHWYVVHAQSGFESKAKQAMEERIRTHHMDTLFGQIHVPLEKVVELVKGQKKTSNRKFFPGYMIVQMVMNEETWRLVKETPKITGFVGDALSPDPLSEEEVERLLSQMVEGASTVKAKGHFEQGMPVKVIDGPFAEFNGTVEEVKPEKSKVKVLISIFGRATPVELDFMQVEKL